MRGFFAVLLLSGVSAHMPAGAGSGTRGSPIDLGDPTVNSWALTGTLSPSEVKHYKFTISGPTTTDSNNNQRFYMGMYVPGDGEPGFTYYTAFFGMNNDTDCERWGDGWGRRQLSSGSHNHDHDVHSNGDAPYRVTSDGTTWLMDSSTIPERVIGHNDAHNHDGFDYHKPSETLVFIASPTTDLPNKFESFSPTLFKPRGSCIADFTRGGEFRIAVWGDASQQGDKKFSLGIGLAERDVFAPTNLMKFDYLLFEVQTWNNWNGFVLILPIVLCAIFALFFMLLVPYWRPKHYATRSGRPTPFRALVLLCSSIIIGHWIMNIAILAWAMSNATVHNGRELIFPIVLTVALPLISGFFTLLIGLNIPACCCCQPKAVTASVCYRVTVGFFGVLHLFLHCGYLIGPALLILASVLPPSFANLGAEKLAVGPTHSGQPAKTDTKAAKSMDTLDVQSTPTTDGLVAP